ncbi:TetR/AcrR family transcriptional regulator [Aeromicrobium chenweiae]|uniref:TetR/AcrR family transcriptional regulator n=1 Tax=Aeromicrobium chenweiae TaxID=2079793 RepID=UPI001900CBD3|nr:TetR/AcrR family transcriptional regulator [Aeromicrobium chenweiae]
MATMQEPAEEIPYPSRPGRWSTLAGIASQGVCAATVSYGHGREAVLDATIRVVSTQGLRGLTYRSVAAEAMVSHGSVQYHFGDWSTLVESALAYCLERSVPATVLGVPEAGLEAFADGIVALVTDQPDLQAFQYELQLEARRPSRAAAGRRADEPQLPRLGRSRAGPSRHHRPQVAEIVFMALEGLVLHQSVYGDTRRTEGAIEALRTLLTSLRNDAS